ncbi:hypothetical protein [Lapidilactobacillus gannanensis]|uniref:Cell surface protein n=1 Tax=Lapidilactobacillus gannanensis TaxID=2486002 RepID=A0ABW4BMV4_9LACO|nr:hypothetical protein [Lapidilactobacillus gannanensis]
MKKGKKVLTSITVAVALLGAFSMTGTQRKVQAASVLWGKMVWAVLKKGSSAVYNIPASLSSGAYGQTVTPGSIELNGSKYGASAMYNVTSQSTAHSLALYAQADLLNLGRKYSLLVLNPHGNYTINTSITPGVYRGFKFGLIGTYKAQFVANSKLKLAPYIAYRYDSANSTFGTRSLSLIEDTIQQDSEINGGQTSYSAGYGEMVTPTWANNVSDQTHKTELNVHELFMESYDNGSVVLSMKDYVPGDQVVVNDVIKQVEYDAENNETKIYFNSTESDEYLKYAGDLTQTLLPGERFEKKMSIEQVGNNSIFRLPSYFKYLLDHDNNAPSFE